MKKLLLCAASLAALVACSLDEIRSGKNDTVFRAGQKVTLCASTGSDSKATSEISGNDINFKWKAGDVIRVKMGDKYSDFTLSSGAGTGSGQFTGKMPDDADLFDVQYPVTEPDLSTQTYVENNLPEDKVYFEANECTTTSFILESQRAVACFQFTGEEKVGKIVLTNTTANPNVAYTLSCPETGVQLNNSTPTPFFIVLDEGTYNFSVDVYDEKDSKICAFSTTSAKTIDADTPLKFDSKKVEPVLVSSVSITETTPINVTISTTDKTLAYEVLPADATDPSVTWESSAPTVATIDATTGVITPVAVGETTISCKAKDGSNKSASCTVNITPDAVSSITLDPASLGLSTGANQTITATVLPETATQTVTWSVTAATPAGCVTVDPSTGEVTAVKAGTATVTCTSTADNTKTASCEVTVTDILVTGLTISDSSISMYLEDGKGKCSKKLSVASITPNNATVQTVTWSADNSGHVTVGTDGTVTAVSTGTAVVTCTADGGTNVTATCSVTVNPVPATGVSLKDQTKSIYLKDSKGFCTYQLSPTVTPSYAADKTVSYAVTSANPTGCVSVDSNGLVTANKVGEATITCTANGGTDVTATCAITVNPVLVSSISLKSTTSIVKEAGEKLTPTISPTYATNQEVTWSTDKSGHATVASDGTVTAVSVGSTVVTCTAKDGSGKSASCTVTVTPKKVESIAINESETSVCIEDTYQLTTTVLPATADDKSCTWSSSKGGVATVDNTGKITAVSPGTATITCTANDGSGKKATWNCVVVGYYVKATSTVENGYYIITNTGTTGINAFKGIFNSGSKVDYFSSSNNAVAATVANNRIKDNSSFDACKVTLTSQGDGEYYIKFNSANEYLAVYYYWPGKGTTDLAAFDSGLYSSSNTAVATVNSSTGAVTVVAAGETTITASAEETDKYWEGSASYTLTINKCAQTLSFASSEVTKTLKNDCERGSTYTIQKVSGASTTVTYSSSNTAVATVNSSTGAVTVIAAGETTISASAKLSDDYKEGSATSYTLKIKKSTQTLSFAKNPVEWYVDKDCTIKGTKDVQSVSGAKTAVTYTSSNSNVATISGTTLTINGVGETTITAETKETEDYSSATKTYTLKVNYQEIQSISPSSIQFSANGSKYSIDGGSNWSDTPSTITPTVATNDGQSTWTVETSNWTSGWISKPSKSSFIISKPSALTTWPSSKPSGTVTVKSRHYGQVSNGTTNSSSKNITVSQNRPLTVSITNVGKNYVQHTVTSSGMSIYELTSKVESTLSVKSDSKWKVTGISTGSVSGTYAVTQNITNDEWNDACEQERNISFNLYWGSGDYSFDILNAEGNKYRVTVTRSTEKIGWGSYDNYMTISISKVQ